jgi:hypothetical protein
MYRAQYAQKTAVHMYFAQQPVTAVVEMIIAEGAEPEQAKELAKTYYLDYAFLRRTASLRQHKQAGMYRTIGLVFVLGSFVLSSLTYLLFDDEQGSFIAYYGLLAFGVLALGKGMLDKRQAEAQLQQLQEQESA